MTTPPKRPVSRILEMSSPIHKRTAELYRERYPVIGTYCDEATWVECCRQAPKTSAETLAAVTSAAAPNSHLRRCSI